MQKRKGMREWKEKTPTGGSSGESDQCAVEYTRKQRDYANCSTATTAGRLCVCVRVCRVVLFGGLSSREQENSHSPKQGDTV